MEKLEKLKLMDKILRELEDTINSETALVKKIAQLEAENINLGDTNLAKKLPEIFEQIDNALATTTELQNEYSVARDKFSSDNKLEETPDVS
jgi:preprotein translocase subunit SecA